MLEDSGTGNVVLRTNYFDVTNAGGSEDIAKFESDGPVSLYHNAIKTFTTIGTGVSVLDQRVVMRQSLLVQMKEMIMLINLE